MDDSDFEGSLVIDEDAYNYDAADTSKKQKVEVGKHDKDDEKIVESNAAPKRKSTEASKEPLKKARR